MSSWTSASAEATWCCGSAMTARAYAPDRLSNVVGSHGIASMRHRVTSLGGQWKIQSPPGGGTLIVARLPLQNVLLKDDVAA